MAVNVVQRVRWLNFVIDLLQFSRLRGRWQQLVFAVGQSVPEVLGGISEGHHHGHSLPVTVRLPRMHVFLSRTSFFSSDKSSCSINWLLNSTMKYTHYTWEGCYIPASTLSVRCVRDFFILLLCEIINSFDTDNDVWSIVTASQSQLT